MNKIPLNWSLMAHPANWVIVLLMVYIVGLAFSLLFHKNVLPSVSPDA